MTKFNDLLAGFEAQAYAALRIVTGLLFIFHGSQKLLDFPKEFTYDLSPLMIAAGGIELIGGILVMIGLLTRPAAFICVGDPLVLILLRTNKVGVFGVRQVPRDQYQLRLDDSDGFRAELLQILQSCRVVVATDVDVGNLMMRVSYCY